MTNHKGAYKLTKTEASNGGLLETTDSVEVQTKSNTKSNISKNRLKKKYVVIALALILCGIGIILIIVATTRDCKDKVTLRHETICGPSNESSRIGLNEFMSKVQDSFFDVQPYLISVRPQVSDAEVKRKFKFHDYKADTVKGISAKSNELLIELQNMAPDLSKLKPREHKSYLMLQHFLQNTFNSIYFNYHAGLWLLGPSSFCYYEPVCLQHYTLHNALSAMKPKNIDDVMHLEKLLEQFKQVMHEYINVLKMGVRKGMVRSQSECNAGLDSIKIKYKTIANKGASAVADSWFVSPLYNEIYYMNIPKEQQDEFEKKYKANVTDYIVKLIEPNVGKPIDEMLKYLEYEYSNYCRPDNVGPGGLSALPLQYVWFNGTRTNNKTNPYIPNCSGQHCRLNGSAAYEFVLKYHTTKDLHPDEVHRLGWENLNKYYPQVLAIAKEVTGLSNTTSATDAFKRILQDNTISYFNERPLPQNETKGDAFKLCSDEDGAKRYCPNRWKAMMKWFEFARMTMSIHDSNMVYLFYFTGNRKSTPSCPVKLGIDFNPSSGAQSYHSTDAQCSSPAEYRVPFFFENLGPKYTEYSLNAHEARPGHHTQVQSYTELFQDDCGGAASWLDDITMYTAFTEGWALYAENPLVSQHTDIYDNEPLQRFGMLKLQIWRALRLIVDTGLHYKGMTRQEALDLFTKYAWDSTDLSQKEVTRYQSNYGQATAYMIGQLDIWQLRNLTEKRLGRKFNLKEFHLQVLSRGSCPLAYLESHIEQFIECKQNPSLNNCDVILNPTTTKTERTSKLLKSYVINRDLKWPKRWHYV